MWRKIFIVGLIPASVGLFFLLKMDNKFEIKTYISEKINPPAVVVESKKPVIVEPLPVIKAVDIELQKPLEKPPEVIKAIYITSWSASSATRIDDFIKLIKKENFNAIVIDIKDYSGIVAYDTDNEDVIKYKGKEVRISKINSVIKKFHDQNIYVIARMAVFQDQVLTSARPDLAVKNSDTGKPWKDNKGLMWVDPASEDAWNYNAKIAKDVSNRGFDELNFDYIRFPSDGPMSKMSFPFYDPKTTYKKDVMKKFFVYLRSNLKGIKISADLFGLTAVNKDDLGIGQVLEDVYQNFDYVSPMVYPSHYASGFLGYKSPAKYPYEVVKYSMDSALKRLKELNEALVKAGGTELTVKLRPWLQDFNLGATYDAEKIKAQIKAVDDSLGKEKSFNGFMLWDPKNIYTRGVIVNN